MATLEEVEVQVSDLRATIANVDLKLDDVRAKIAALEAGNVTQEQIDALAASLESAKTEAASVLTEASGL